MQLCMKQNVCIYIKNTKAFRKKRASQKYKSLNYESLAALKKSCLQKQSDLHLVATVKVHSKVHLKSTAKPDLEISNCALLPGYEFQKWRGKHLNARCILNNHFNLQQ